jgi:Domain of unknown function (DUF6471)
MHGWFCTERSGDRGPGISVFKVEMKRAGITYADHTERLGKHGVKGETEASIKNKLARGTFPATFFVASLAALEKEGMMLDEI